MTDSQHKHSMKFTIIGAGNTGQAMAGYIAMQGHQVLLFSRSKEKSSILQKRGIEMTGTLSGFVKIQASSDITEAVEFSEYLIICTTAQGHQDIARMLKPHLKEGQTLIIFNGNWGALEFKNILSDTIKTKNITIAETGAMMLICNASTPGKVHIEKIKQSITIATLDKDLTQPLIDNLKAVFPQFNPVKDVFETSLNNSNTIIHTPVTLCNAARIDGAQEFLFYSEGASVLAVKYIEKLDSERLIIGQNLGICATGVLEIINSFWPKKHDCLYDAIHMNDSYRVVTGPKTLDHRYVYEDVPFGLVPLSILGKHLGVPTPSIDSVIDAFDVLLDEDFRSKGPALDYDSIISEMAVLGD